MSALKGTSVSYMPQGHRVSRHTPLFQGDLNFFFKCCTNFIGNNSFECVLR